MLKVWDIIYLYNQTLINIFPDLLPYQNDATTTTMLYSGNGVLNTDEQRWVFAKR